MTDFPPRKYPKTKPRPKADSKLRLPHKEFLYTLDQVAGLLEIPIRTLWGHLWFDGKVDQEAWTPKRMRAVSIARDDSLRPKWRVSETEFIRYLKYHHIEVYHDA